MKNKTIFPLTIIMTFIGLIVNFAADNHHIAAQEKTHLDSLGHYLEPGNTESPFQIANGEWVMPANSTHSNNLPTSYIPTTTGGPDNFGYIWDDSVSLNWIDATVGVDTGMSGSSFGQAVGLIPLPFTFNYYENFYSHLYIAASGYIGFSTDTSWQSQPTVPDPATPNNIIAPYATPLVLADTGVTNRVYYHSGGVEPDRYFVVEWYQVTSIYDGNDTFTFQVILHENGNIDFQYLGMEYVGGFFCGTSGMENIWGADGLNYVNFCNAAPSYKSVRFYRPPASARVDVYPTTLGEFTSPGATKTFQLFIRNIGDFGGDTFDLDVTTNNNWNTTFYTEDGGKPLIDSNSNGLLDTGIISPATSITVNVQIDAPTTAVLGDDNTTTILIRSTLNPNVVKNVTFNVAIPAPFIQTFTDKNRAMSYYLARPQSSLTGTLTPSVYYGTEAAATELTDGNMIYTWTKGRCLNTDCTLYSSEIEYQIVNACGQPRTGILKLTDHSQVDINTYDYNAAIAVAPNGDIGILWRRYLYDSSVSQYNYNMYLAILGEDGNLIQPAINLTNNTTWGTSNDLNIIRFFRPRITATQDNRFVVVWLREYKNENGWVDDIYYAIYDTNNSQFQALTQLTYDEPDDFGNYAPNLTTISSNRAIITWVNRSDGNDDIYYSIIDSSGNTVKSTTNLSIDETVIDWWNADVTEMSDGRILVAWEAWGCFPDEWTSRIRFAILDPAYNTIIPATCLNDEPIATEQDQYISVTSDNANNAIFTWTNSNFDTLYYALVNSSGYLVTPPMPFYPAEKSLTDSGYISVNSQGYGNAPFTYYQALACQTMLPITLNNALVYFNGPWEIEPNNTFSQANGFIRSGQTYFGTISDPSDVNDYFSFKLTVPHTVEIFLTQIANGSNFNLTLRDINLNVVGYSGNLNNQDEHILTGALPVGQYYIQISNSSGTGSNQAYNLLTVYE